MLTVHNNTAKHTIDASAAGVAGLSIANVWLQSVDHIIAIIAGLCAITWYVIRFIEYVKHKKGH
jgi:hypothetical protein